MKPRLAVALDVPTTAAAVSLGRELAGTVSLFKVGLELFVAEGPAVVEAILPFGEVFLDLKLHDIPETVSRAVASSAKLGATYLTLHTSGGAAMMAAAAEAAAKAASKGSGKPSLQLLGVTVLTSLDGQGLGDTEEGRAVPIDERVLRRAELAKRAGCHGIVASPLELSVLRPKLPSPFVLVTPGIRPHPKGGASSAAPPDDQKRVATAGQAVAAGADILVVGRPIRDAVSPREAALALLEEMANS